MRLDKYLKVSRLIKRRTVANEACDAGRISVNSKPARASYEVKEGCHRDRSGRPFSACQVVSVKGKPPVRKEAALMYRLMD